MKTKSLNESRFPDVRHFSDLWYSGIPQFAAVIFMLGLNVTTVHQAHGSFTDVTDQTPFAQLEQLPPGALDPQSAFVSRGGAPLVLDYDDDGWLDVYVVRHGLPDVLLRNQSGTFTRVDNPFNLTSTAGNAPAWADFDNDGRRDLFLATLGSHRYELHMNRGNGVFVDEALARGVALESTAPHRGAGVAVGDINLDGYLDIFVGDWGVTVDDSTRSQHFALFLNQGSANPGYFINITASAGLEFNHPELNFYAPIISDIDGDGWPDLPTVVDFRRSRLFWNNGDATFTDGTISAGVSIEENGMGTAIGDVDRDGELDWFVTSIRFDGYPGYFGNQLYINQGDRRLVSVSDEPEISLSVGGWGWGTNFFDYDNDGRLDVVMTNGIADPASSDFAPMLLWRNSSTESRLSFLDVSDLQGVNHAENGAGIVTFDYDQDGDLDILVIHQDAPPRLLRNDPRVPQNWIRLSLSGTSSNRDAIGTRVTLEATAGGPIQTAEYNPTNTYLAQLEPVLHFGLGDTSTISRFTIRWPNGGEQTLRNIPANQVIEITESPAAASAPVFTTVPAGGTFLKGSEVGLTASAIGSPAPVYVWRKDGQPIPGATGPELRLRHISPSNAGSYTVQAINAAGTRTSPPAVIDVEIDPTTHSVARWWNEFLLDGIRRDTPDPPVHARNLLHLSAAMWDAYWAYDPIGWNRAAPIYQREDVPIPAIPTDRIAAQREAISYAAHRVLTTRFARSPGHARTLFDAHWLMQRLGYDPTFISTVGDSPAAIGNRIGQAVLDNTYYDGANEAGHYADATGYTPVNDPLIVALSGTAVTDPNRWQPLALRIAVTQNGIVQPDGVQSFVGANALVTTPFALVKPTPTSFAWDPGPPPRLSTTTDAEFKTSALDVIRYSAQLDPTTGVMVDISPGARMNNPLGSDSGTGHALNPTTGQPYDPNVVNLADYGRIMAEYWADGPDSETPPGHWNVLLNEVTDHPAFRRHYAGTGPELSPLEWDIRAYLALNGAMHDAACAAWGIKHIYDSPRPISMIRYLGGRGQSSDPTGASYDPAGLPLEPNLVEVVTAASSAPGARHAHLANHVGEIAIYAWRGAPLDPVNSTGGVGWIRAVDWVPYQLDTFVSPAFPGYVSGHSTFSRAGAEVLTLLTGSPFFPGGLGEQHFFAHRFLRFESGPSTDFALQWATYYDAADQAGRSRLWGGIHIAADDGLGRRLGAQIGLDAFLKVEQFHRGNIPARGLYNLSTRGRSGAGDDVMITGFVIDEVAGAESTVLLRTVGPTLAQYGISAAECDQDPALALHSSHTSAPFLQNDDWQRSDQTAAITARATAVGAFALPADSKDAAALVSLPPGSYTVVNTSASPASSGIALAEIYGEPLANLSTRGKVGREDDVLIAGFAVGGNEPSVLLIRGIGPRLADFGVSGPLTDPVIEVYRHHADGSHALVARNDDWSESDTSSLTEVVGFKAGAFSLAPQSADAALVEQFPPGLYSAVVSGATGATGIALVEVYHVR
jgi:hypothetical protein